MDSDGSAEETNNNSVDDSVRDSNKRKNDLDISEMEEGASLTSLKRMASSEKEEPSSNSVADPAPNISVGPPFQPPHLLPYLYPPGLYPGAQGLAGLPGLMLPGTSSPTSLGPHNLPLPLLGSTAGSHHGSSALSPPTSLPMAHNLLLAHNLLAAGAGQHLLGHHGYQGLAGLTSLSTTSTNTTTTPRETPSTTIGAIPSTSSSTSPANPSPHLPDRLKPSRFTPYLPSSSSALSSLSSVLSSSLSSISSPLSSSLSSSLFGDSSLGVSSAFQAVSPKSGASRIDEHRRALHSITVASELKSIEKMVNGLDRRPPELTDALKMANK